MTKENNLNDNFVDYICNKRKILTNMNNNSYM